MIQNIILFYAEGDCNTGSSHESSINTPAITVLNREDNRWKKVKGPDARVSRYIGLTENEIRREFKGHHVIDLSSSDKIIEIRNSKGTVTCFVREGTCINAWLFTD